LKLRAGSLLWAGEGELQGNLKVLWELQLKFGKSGEGAAREIEKPKKGSFGEFLSLGAARTFWSCELVGPIFGVWTEVVGPILGVWGAAGQFGNQVCWPTAQAGTLGRIVLLWNGVWYD
jgi:hypothetical protein